MAGVDGLSNGNKYTEAELERSRTEENLSTQQAINTIGNHAGLDTTHAVHGRDATEAEIAGAHQDRMAAAWTKELVSLGCPMAVVTGEIAKELKDGKIAEALETGGKEALLEVAKEVVGHVLEHAFHAADGAGTLAVALPWELGKLAKVMCESVADSGETGLARAESHVRAAMHVVITGSLNGLPQEFVNESRARYLADAPKDLVKRMGDALGRGDNALMAVIQHHCDEGLAAARTMFDSQQMPADFFRAHPDLGKRFANDPAFHDGFAGAMYARAHGQYQAVMQALDARDPRSAQTQIAFRG